ncbi:MAG TPA: CHAT domain-containing protein [Acidobacteriota bacterium]|nr:CHAT domain-containing protein [Acidobacteriota bacterium]
MWVEQKAADLKLRLHASPDHSDLFDAPNHFRGRELLLLEPGQAHTVQVDVVLDPAEPPAQADLHVESLKDAPPEQISALRALMMAALAEASEPPSHQQALEHLYQALAEFEKLDDHSGQADVLFQRSVVKGSLGRRQEAVEDLQASILLWEDQGDRSMQAMARNSLGLIYFGLGRRDEAREQLSAAMEAFQELHDEVGLSVATANWCLTVHAGGDLSEARQCYSRALELGHANQMAWLEAIQHTNLARVADLLGEPDRARDHYQQALDIYSGADRPISTARTLQNQAVLLRRIGEVQGALLLYRQALQIFQQNGEVEWEARTLTSLGRAYLELGEVDRALSYFRQALPLRREAGDRRGEGHTLVNLAGALQEDGQMEASLPQLEKALSLYRELEYPQGTVSVLRLIGKVHSATGNLPEAERFFQESLEAARQLRRPLQEAAAHQHLGRLKAQRSQFEEALEHLDKSIRLCASVRPCQADSHLARARVELQAGRPSKAEPAVDEAISIIESLRERISSPERRASYLATQREAYQLKIGLLMERHWESPSKGLDQRALEFSERGRTRALVEYLREAQSEIAADLSDDLLERREELRRNLNFKAAAQLRAEGSGREDQAAQLENELSAILAEIDNLEADIRRRHPRYAQLTRPTALMAPRIRGLLDEDTLLLEFALSAQGPSHLWLVSPQQVNAYRLAQGNVIEEAARQAFALISRFDPQRQRQREQALQHLSRLLLEPVGQEIAKASRLVVVSDGALHYIPFAALNSPLSPEKPLLEDHEIVHLPSASALAVQRGASSTTPKEAPCRAAVLADPVYSPHDERLEEGVGAAPLRAGEGAEFERLYASRREAEAIVSLSPAGATQALTGLQANLEALHSPRVRDCRVLHFATHGLIDDHRPELSGLVLSQYGPDGSPQDGFLRMLDVYALDLKAELVVLSGCQTADGKMVGGEGLVGLTRGFMHAGVPRVVASLWQVQDRATAELMRNFYRGLWQEGLAPAAALRRAQLEVRRDRRWRDPYFWTAFVFQGDWR